MPRKGSGAPLSPSLILSSLARLDKQIDASLKARSIGSAVRGRWPPRGFAYGGEGTGDGLCVKGRTDCASTDGRTWTRHELTHLGTAVFSLVRRATLSAATMRRWLQRRRQGSRVGWHWKWHRPSASVRLCSSRSGIESVRKKRRLHAAAGGRRKKRINPVTEK